MANAPIAKIKFELPHLRHGGGYIHHVRVWPACKDNHDVITCPRSNPNCHKDKGKCIDYPESRGSPGDPRKWWPQSARGCSTGSSFSVIGTVNGSAVTFQDETNKGRCYDVNQWFDVQVDKVVQDSPWCSRATAAALPR